ncbi:N-acetylgalactosamine-6-sulfatase [Holothuria leucospilota]|uniref:N-acetylgalactosamine-6-sulfatase n=1 Tax=Holothuria leucospilota TaxID=206669 RepID=A0A9Q1CQW0_HOLLE|nr:N-acetylgalactosamine-6-sulfatase [Holothuria leucospilota]
MGYADLGCYGNEARETPNIDKLAKEGALFTDFYSAYATCSPSRAAMLTGRLPIRNGIYTNNTFGVNAVDLPDTIGGLPAEEETIAEVLAKLGYRNKVIGKWHVGNLDESFPLNQGFDEFFGSKDNRMGPYTEEDYYPNPPVYRDDKMVGRYFEGEFFMNLDTGESDMTRLWTEDALNFIDENKNNPFFLYWAADGTHTPIVAHKDFLDTSERGHYGDVVRDLDFGVGQIMAKLMELELHKDTFVFFGSDNGPAGWKPLKGGSAGPFLCSKTTTFEGGMRVPGIFWWPDVIPAGQIERIPSNLVDLFPTILEITGGKQSDPMKVLDGQSLWPILIDNPADSLKKDNIFYYRGTGLYAVRVGQYKAHYWSWNTSPRALEDPLYGDPCPGVCQAGFVTMEQTDHRDEPVLFHLGRDPGEKFPMDPATDEYQTQLAIINKVRDEHLASLEGDVGYPQLNYSDRSLCGWAPPGCEEIDMCLPVPESEVVLKEWYI